MDDKNNKPLGQIEKRGRGKAQKSVPDIAEDSKSEEEVIAEERDIEGGLQKNIGDDLKEEHVKEIQSAREERKKYANKTFRFLWIYVGIVIVVVISVVVADIVVAVLYDKRFLGVIPLTTLIATIPASMALFGWVLRGLFPIDKNK